MYRLHNISKIYSGVTALDNVNCDINTDSFTFIMGPSGAGKSTLLRLLSFVELPDLGTVRLELDGHVFDSETPARPWPRVTCVFQKQFLWPHLTLYDNIMLPLRATHAADRDSRVRNVIDLLDMSTFVHRFPNETSGGQAQRAALARALALQPQLILIDEPHGGLDIVQQDALNTHLIRLRALGVGLMVVTHSVELARRYADQVIVVEDGRVTEVGSRDAFDNPTSRFLRRAIKDQPPSEPTPSECCRPYASTVER